MRFYSIAISMLALCLGLTIGEHASAQNNNEPRVSVVTDSLDHPFSVTIEPGTNRVIVAESGAQRIVEIKDGQAIELAADFPESEFRGYKVGPIAVASAGESAMIVSHGSSSGKASLTRLLRGTEKNEEDPPEYDRQTVEIESVQERELGPLSHVMLKNSLVYVVTNGDPRNGWIAVAEIQNKKLTPLSPSIATSLHTGCESPTSIALSPDGAYLVVSQMGKRDKATDSRLAFYSLGGQLLQDYPIELGDVTALAYSPNRKHLFVIDSHFADPKKGGLYKVIAAAGTETCTLKKIADLSYATSMAFDDSGTLWVTTLGDSPNKENEQPGGKLIKIEGLDDPFEVDRSIAEPLESILPRKTP